MRAWMTSFERVPLQSDGRARTERGLLRQRAAAARARAAASRSGRGPATTGRAAATSRSSAEGGALVTPCCSARRRSTRCRSRGGVPPPAARQSARADGDRRAAARGSWRSCSGCAERTGDLRSPLLSEVVLYALVAVDLAILRGAAVRAGAQPGEALGRAAAGPRRSRGFAASSSAALLAMTIVPAVLVLITGSEIIARSAARWFSAPVDEVLTPAKNIASQYYQERQEVVTQRARRLARVLPVDRLVGRRRAPRSRGCSTTNIATMRAGTVDLYRVVPGATGPPDVELFVAVQTPSTAAGTPCAAADRLAARALDAGREGPRRTSSTAARLRPHGRRPSGAGIGDCRRRRRLAVDRQPSARSKPGAPRAAYEQYQAMRVLQGPAAGRLPSRSS